MRIDEIYCDYPKPDGKTCREKGVIQEYNERLKQNKALAEYRRLYQLKSMAVGRNKDNKQMKKDFDKWKKDAKIIANLQFGSSIEIKEQLGSGIEINYCIDEDNNTYISGWGYANGIKRIRKIKNKLLS